ncbi:MAG: alpha/beta hydrolase, partial [Parvibaculaceae bacterium]|nr:alpha/beta hydrolase [Parvibaculaceae bacterium]
PEQVKGIVLIAPAPDFTEDLMWAGFDEDIKKTLLEDGLYSQPSDYDEPYEITLKLIEDGRNHLLLNKPIPLHCPVRIFQGMQDEDVPWEHAVRTLNALASDDVTLQLNKVGDHRLSEPDDIARLMHTVEDLLALAAKTELEVTS